MKAIVVTDHDSPTCEKEGHLMNLPESIRVCSTPRVLSDSFATFYRMRLTELAAKHKLPAIYGHSQFIEAGV